MAEFSKGGTVANMGSLRGGERRGPVGTGGKEEALVTWAVRGRRAEGGGEKSFVFRAGWYYSSVIRGLCCERRNACWNNLRHSRQSVCPGGRP